MPPAYQHCNLLAIGASAGGLEALKEQLSVPPPDLNAVVVVAMHRGPGRPSILPHIPHSFITMPISDAVDGQRLEHGHVYVAIADQQLTIKRGCTRVRPSPKQSLFCPCAAEPALVTTFLPYHRSP